MYEDIGRVYSRHRAADPRIVQELAWLLGPSLENRVIVDVGAGTGSYSIALTRLGYRLIAVEPSATMREQARDTPGVRWVAGTAEHLPLADSCADGAVCVLALHHFSNVEAALHEMRRVLVSGPIVIFTFDPRLAEPFWFEDYFPDLWREAHDMFPPLDDTIELLGRVASQNVEVYTFRLPHDLQDRFAAAGWRQPEMYLDEGVQASMSAFALADTRSVREGLRRLRRDLDSGAWLKRHGSMLELEHFDAGYRFLRAGRTP